MISINHRLWSGFLVAFVLPTVCLANSNVKVGVKAGVLDGILSAGPFVQFLLLTMITLSVLSWGIIFTKWRQLNELREANEAFSERFWQAPSLEAVHERLSEFNDSNMARVFKAAFLELQRIADSGLANKEAPPQQTNRLRGLDNLERTLRKAIDREVAAAESRLQFLATTGSTSPFVGLLGTVVGIMTSFHQIAASGSASLAVVAPGISEALFATAVGLFAALPAVAGYNYFIGQVRRIEIDLNSFSSDFLNIAKRNFFLEG
jgi:biopolymer transport protein TolQ